jgi:hypothetical protein
MLWDWKVYVVRVVKGNVKWRNRRLRVGIGVEGGGGVCCNYMPALYSIHYKASFTLCSITSTWRILPLPVPLLPCDRRYATSQRNQIPVHRANPTITFQHTHPLPTITPSLLSKTMSSQRIHLNPNAPRAPMMNQGYQPDPIGNRRPQGQRSENEVLARVQDVSSKVEDAIEHYTQVGPLHY